MDRRIKEYLSEDEIIQTPYTNHIGSGNIIGSGDSSGKGTCFTYKPRKEDYKGSDILSYNGNKVYFIDGYSLYFTHIHKPWASAKIIKNDLTTQDCYVGKTDEKFYQYTIIDEATRERFIYAYNSHDSFTTVDFVLRSIIYFGYIPEIIQTDNGFEFTNNREKSDKSLHLFDELCKELNIVHKLIKPRTPRHNGKVERSHRNDQERFYSFLS